MEETSVPYSKPGFQAKPASQLGTVLTLFMVLRLTVLFFYSQQGLFNNYIDYHHYYRTALLSEQGFYPFINMWYEYPPILAYLPQLAYWLAGAIITPVGVDSFSYQLFIRILGLFLLVFDALSLVLVHDICKRLWGKTVVYDVFDFYGDGKGELDGMGVCDFEPASVLLVIFAPRRGGLFPATFHLVFPP